MTVTVLYVGSSLLSPLRNAEREINRDGIDLNLAMHNFGGAFDDDQWATIEKDLSGSAVIFVIHVLDGENASRLLPILDRCRSESSVVVINCMPDLMRRTRLGKLDFAKLPGGSHKQGSGAGTAAENAEPDAGGLIRSVAAWV